MIQLRSYQRAALDGVRASYRDGRTAPILVAPTGSGKTVMAAAVIQGATARGRRVLFLAHRFELVAQACMKLAACGIPHAVVAPPPSVRQIAVQEFRALGRSWVDNRASVLVGTVQTQSRRLGDVMQAPDMIIIDECHLSIAPSYQRIVEEFPKALLLGLTATPTRLDGKGLGRHAGGLYDELVTVCTPDELLDSGFLVPARIFGEANPLDLSGVRTVRGDYDQQQVAEIVDKPTLIGDAVEHYTRVAKGRPAIAFCVSVKHAQDTAERFTEAGYRAVWVSGDSDPEDRARAVAGLGDGSVDIVCNCGLYIEGLDQTAIACVIMLTPTQSLTRFLQSVGRGLRPHPGKADCIVLDHAGNTLRHGHPFEARDWTLDGVQRRKRASDGSADVAIQTCPKCYTIHRPAPHCPTCGHVYRAAARREPDQAEGDLVELSREQAEALRRQKRVLQGQAQTLDDLVAQGMSKYRAQKILDAREAKAALVGALMDDLARVREDTGRGPYQAFGVTLGDLRRMKPRELRDLHERVRASLTEAA